MSNQIEANNEQPLAVEAEVIAIRKRTSVIQNAVDNLNRADHAMGKEIVRFSVDHSDDQKRDAKVAAAAPTAPDEKINAEPIVATKPRSGKNVDTPQSPQIIEPKQTERPKTHHVKNPVQIGKIATTRTPQLQSAWTFGANVIELEAHRGAREESDKTDEQQTAIDLARQRLSNAWEGNENQTPRTPLTREDDPETFRQAA